MDYNQISDSPVYPGWGLIWQGGGLDAEVQSFPGPLILVTLDIGEDDPVQYVDHNTIHSVLNISIHDTPEAVLPDDVFLSLVDACIAFLKNGINLYIHCGQGVSRSSYLDIGLHMRMLRIPYDEAFSLIKKKRSVIDPNSGFEKHLRSLEKELMCA